MQLLDFLNLGGGEVVLLTIIILPFLLTIYCAVDIIRSNFKDLNTKLLFLLLVLAAPLIGSIIYLIMKGNYIKHNEPFNP